jgi:hypothetical protein
MKCEVRTISLGLIGQFVILFNPVRVLFTDVSAVYNLIHYLLAQP